MCNFNIQKMRKSRAGSSLLRVFSNGPRGTLQQYSFNSLKDSRWIPMGFEQRVGSSRRQESQLILPGIFGESKQSNFD